MKPNSGFRHPSVMQGSSALVACGQQFQRGLLVAILVGLFAGCIDDRPSGPGGIRSETGGAQSSTGTGNSGGATGSGGTTGARGTTISSQSASSGGSVGAGGTTASSQPPSSGGNSGTGGTATSSQTGSSGGAGGHGGTVTSGQSASSGGNAGTGGTATSSGNRDAGGPPGRDSSLLADAASPTDAATVSFTDKTLPLLKTNCVSCHGPSQQNAGVRLDSYAVVKTNLTAATNAIAQGIMPPTGGLATSQRQLFQTWVNQGALNN